MQAEPSRLLKVQSDCCQAIKGVVFKEMSSDIETPQQLNETFRHRNLLKRVEERFDNFDIKDPFNSTQNSIRISMSMPTSQEAGVSRIGTTQPV